MYKTLTSKTVYVGRNSSIIFDETELQNGEKWYYEYEARPDFVVIVAVTSDAKIVMVEQDRYVVKKRLIELPMGKVDAGHTPLQTAAKELEEEAGYTTDNFIILGAGHVAPGSRLQTAHYYLAQDIAKTDSKREATELDMVTKLMTVDEVKEYIRSGKIIDAPTIVAFHLYLGHLKLL